MSFNRLKKKDKELKILVNLKKSGFKDLAKKERI